MKPKAPPFTWSAFLEELERDPGMDVFALFSFHQVGRYEKQQIAQRVIEARLAAKPKWRKTQ